jgi:isoleucyl-tRNA synthetase
MLAMSTIMERQAPFKVCFGYGLVLGEDGREMHKSWGNAIEFDEAAETMGADVMRWLYCTKRPETNLLFGYQRAEEVKKRFLIPLWNVYSFFVTYAKLDNWTPRNSVDYSLLSLLDRWVLSKLNVLISDVTRYMEDYNPCDAALSVERFVEDLSTWYIRRSRRRFWKSERDLDKNAAYTTLYTCLTTLVKLLAPFIPFITEEIYQNIVCSVDPDAPKSVHHNDWPVSDEKFIDKDLMADMELAMKVCSLGRSARTKMGIKLRQPLPTVTIVAEKPLLDRILRMRDIIMDELNVKDISLTTERGGLFEYKVKPLPEVLGKKYGSLYPQVREKILTINSRTLKDSFEKGLTIDVEVNGQIVKLEPNDVQIEPYPKEGFSLAEEEGLLVAVDARLTDILKMEGLARDIVRRIQNQRKEAGFNIADNIETYYEAGPKLTQVFEAFGNYIGPETLSVNLYKGEPPREAYVSTYEIDGESLKIGIVRLKR